MEQGIQQILQDVQNQLADLALRKKEFEEQMRQQKEEFEKWRMNEEAAVKQNIEESLVLKESELIEREKKLSAQEEFIRDQQLKNSKIIKLNVGGKQFTTTLTTLTNDKDSMLAAMFSGRYALEKDGDGYFIDRDGELFSFILDYLRTGRLNKNITEEECVNLLHEAQYFQLSGLTRELASPSTSLHYGGIYVRDSTVFSFINSKLVTDFRDESEYSLDCFNTVKFAFGTKYVGLIIDKNTIRIKNDTLLEYHAPALPDFGSPYSYSTWAVTFKDESVVIEKSGNVNEELQTTHSSTSAGVPMIVADSDSKSLFNFLHRPVFYCYGKCFVVRGLNPSENAFSYRIFQQN